MNASFGHIRNIATNALICFTASLCGHTSVNAESALVDINRVPSSIEWLQAGGYWSAGKREGRYRVIVTAGGFEHISRRLFLQWIETGTRSRESAVVSTVAVKEIGFVHGGRIEVTIRFGKQNAFEFTATVERRGTPRRTFAVTAYEIGRYSIRQK